MNDLFNEKESEESNQDNHDNQDYQDDQDDQDDNQNNKLDRKSKYVPPSSRKNEDATEREDRNRKLIIRNIPIDIMEDDIADIITSCGKLYDVRIHRDKYTGKSKGFAFVKCETHEIANKIIETYNIKPLGKMIMKIDFAEDKKTKR